MISIVSGLPRSGTSLMMQMLAAGGMPIMSDEIRAPDTHNPRGYLEDRRVKSLESDNTWLAEAEGHALKVISLLLYELPTDLQYRVVFMRRDLDEVLRSQHRMLAADSNAHAAPEIRTHFERHLVSLSAWFPRQSHLELLEIDYCRVVREPETAAASVAGFLKQELDLAAMASVVDPSLYRNRNSSSEDVST
ncbi:MAG: sulfotransferase family protein [Planctomycetaceae bacterium]|jgi:LPS sulfotransferase NodH